VGKYLTAAKRAAKEYDINPSTENANEVLEAAWQFYCLEADTKLWHRLVPPPAEEE